MTPEEERARRRREQQRDLCRRLDRLSEKMEVIIRLVEEKQAREANA